MKLCVDCRWIQPAGDIQNSKCGHATATRTVTSPVDGSTRIFQVPCQSFRLLLEGCDVEGKLWERKGVGFE